MPLPYLNIMPYPAFTVSPPSVPALYWDVYSQEQRIKKICEMLHKSEMYMDYIAKTMNEYAADLNSELAEELEKLHDDFDNLREELILLVKELGAGVLTWDVQQGRYTSSVEAMRDMFNDVTVHALTIEELNELDMTVEELANSGLNTRGLAVMSRWLVDHDEPLYPPYMSV